VFGGVGAAPDYSMMQTCFQIFISELEKLYEIRLGKDYPKFNRARKMYDECLEDEDYEKMPEDYPLEIPSWLNTE